MRLRRQSLKAHVDPKERGMAAFTSFDSPKPSRLAHQREEGAARRRIRLTCMSANLCASAGQQRPNLEGARITPRPQKSSTSLQKGLALAREESVAVLARAVEPRRET